MASSGQVFFSVEGFFLGRFFCDGALQGRRQSTRVVFESFGAVGSHRFMVRIIQSFPKSSIHDLNHSGFLPKSEKERQFALQCGKEVKQGKCGMDLKFRVLNYFAAL